MNLKDPKNPTAAPTSKLKLLLGLSRTPHGILDLATPAMAALLWLGKFPSAGVVIIGVITAFAGYTAVYALNDLVDLSVDRDRLSRRDDEKEVFHVDEIMVRHPVAQGLLSFRNGFLWFAFWAVIALLGAWWLNPVCAVLFVVCTLLEALYCKLLRVTHWKIIPSALVKASGGLVGVLAVDPNPSPGFLALLLLWLAAWEVGGQNIANDIVDKDDDLRVSARTTATVKGVPESVFRVVAAVSMAAFAGTAIYWLAGAGVGSIYPIGAVILGWLLLLSPARSLYYAPGSEKAAALFNRASYMPAAFLLLTVAAILAPF
jgi:4-hydroxybenzoate polyprenyltransferase